MNVESMLEPVSPNALCGEDVTYDDIMAGEIDPLLDPGMEYQSADDPSPPKQKPIDWQEVNRLSTLLFAKGKHLRLAVLLTESGMELRGLQGLRDGLALIEGLCSRYWDEVYPNEEPYLAQERSILLNGLTDSRFVKRVGKIPLAESRVAGRFSWEDYQKAKADARDNPDAANTERLITGVFERETTVEKHRETQSDLAAMLESVVTMQRVFDEKMTGSHQVNFRDLRKQIEKMTQFIAPFADPAAAASAGDTSGEGGEESSGHSAGGGSGSAPAPGTVNSRESAIAAMDRIIAYFERAEPSSPVPFLLRRTQRCVNLNFLDLVEELASARAAFEGVLLGGARNE